MKTLFFKNKNKNLISHIRISFIHHIYLIYFQFENGVGLIIVFVNDILISAMPAIALRHSAAAIENNKQNKRKKILICDNIHFKEGN